MRQVRTCPQKNQTSSTLVACCGASSFCLLVGFIALPLASLCWVLVLVPSSQPVCRILFLSSLSCALTGDVTTGLLGEDKAIICMLTPKEDGRASLVERRHHPPIPCPISHLMHEALGEVYGVVHRKAGCHDHVDNRNLQRRSWRGGFEIIFLFPLHQCVGGGLGVLFKVISGSSDEWRRQFEN